MEVALREAKNKLSHFGNIAHDGKRVVVSRHGRPWFDLTPHCPTSRRTTCLQGVKPTISVREAIAPIDHKDIHGWI